MTPSVGGWRKARVAALLAVAAGASGGLAGFAAGAVWALPGLPRPGPAAVPVAIGLTAVADGLLVWTGRPRPPSVRRQVPVLWTRLFAAETVALLFGARLGVGPLTILTGWAWWTAFVLGAASGPLGGLAIGGLFGVTRVILIVGVAEWARRDMAVRMRQLARREVAISVLAVVTYLTLLPITVSDLLQLSALSGFP